MSTSEINAVTRGELPCWRLENAHGSVLVAEQGAQVLEYSQHGQPPVIWLSEQAQFRQGHSVRGGVPVCWPWFGELARNPAAVQQQYPLQAMTAPAPAHGLARQQNWQLSQQHQQGERLSLLFELAPLPALPEVSVQLEVTLEQSLTLRLHCHNQRQQSVAISQALHSYLAVSDIHHVQVRGLEGCPYVDALDQWQRHQQQGPLQFAGETDRLYSQLPSELRVVDPLWQRQLRLSASGSRSAVVWNPWQEKSTRLSQFHRNAWTGMLCIETARVLEDVLLLDAGEQHSMAVTITAEPL